MSGFLSRWSRLKRTPEPPAPTPEPAIDEASLPPIETLAADSDFSAFLRAGVSAALQTRALQVAWSSDPAIAGFRGMAEYDWDFNAVGYGRLAAGDNVATMLRALIEPRAEPEPEAEPAALVAEAAPIEALPEPPEEARPEQAEPEPPAPRVRRHGGALPA
jgi:hypothetical protein